MTKTYSQIVKQIETLKQEAEKALPRADAALDKLNTIPADSLGGGDLKQRIETCVKSIKSTAETQLLRPATSGARPKAA